MAKISKTLNKLTALVALGAMVTWSGAAHAAFFDSIMEARTIALPLLSASGVILALSFVVVGRVTKKKRLKVVAEYEAELDKFRRSIRTGGRR